MAVAQACTKVRKRCYQVVMGETECPECGTENDDDAKFCKNCGAKL